MSAPIIGDMILAPDARRILVPSSISFSTAKTDWSPTFLTYADVRSAPRDAIGTLRFTHRSLIEPSPPARTNDSARTRALRPLRQELRGTGIRVVLIEPGPITSRFRENAHRIFERTVLCENPDTANRGRIERWLENQGSRVGSRGPPRRSSPRSSRPWSKTTRARVTSSPR